MFFRAAAMTLRTVLLSLQALLAAAEPDDPQDAVVANQVGVHLSVSVMINELWLYLFNFSSRAERVYTIDFIIISHWISDFIYLKYQ